MLKVIPFRRQHLADITHQNAQVLMCDPASATLENHPAFSLQDQNGRVVACGGMHPIWSGRWGTWAFMEPATSRHMLQIVRLVRDVIALHPVRRLEAQVLVGFVPGLRFAKAIGMSQETSEPMRGWTPDGEDVHQFVLVKGL